MFLDSGRNPEYTEGNHTCKWRTYKLHTKKKQRPQARFELVTTSANYHKTVQPHEYDDDKVCSICSFSYVALPTPTSSTLFSLFDRYISVYHL